MESAYSRRQPDNAGAEKELLARGSRWFINAWQRPILNSTANKVVLFAAMAALCGVRAYIGLIGTRNFSHDAFMLFDGAWRMLNGQHPHIDFYSHVGYLTYVPTVIGLWLARGTAWGFGYGQALSGLLTGCWAYWLGRKRLADVPLVLLCLSVVLMTVAPFALGFSPMRPTPGMIYNRQGYAFLALILVEAFEKAKPASERDEFWGGISSGSILAILFFLKITYFAAAVILVALLLPCRTQMKQRWSGIAGGLLGITLASCAYYSFHMGPLLHDLITIGGGKHIHFGWYLLDLVLQDAAIATALAIAAALLLSAYGNQRAGLSVILAGAAITLAGMAMILGNYEQVGFPLTVFLAIVVLNQVNLQVPEQRLTPDFFQAAVLVFGSALIAGSLTSGLGGMTFALGQRLLAQHTQHFRMARLSGFTTGLDDDWYAQLVNDGVPLIERFRRSNDTLMSLDFTNPFSYGLGMHPAHGGTPVFQFGTTFNDRFRPSPEFLIGAADLIVVPKKASDPTLDDNVPRLYGPYLKSHFHLVGESRDWRLYRRNGE